MSLPSVILKPKRALPFFGRHPWVYAGAVERIDGAPADGAEVNLLSSPGNFVARGFFNSRSKIQVRLYSWSADVPLDEAFFRQKLTSALKLRHDVLKLNTSNKSAYRMVFSEADGLSGLIVDRYGDWLSVQFTSLALEMRREMIIRLLQELTGCKGIYLRTEKGISKLEGVTLLDCLLWGEAPPAEAEIEENGLRFAVNLTEGQKTGYFLDQRDNRQALARLAPGRKVLDAFCYSGGFGLHAAKAGASSVVCLDASEPALQLAQRNAELNELKNLRFDKGDVFGKLTEYQESGEKFDMIMLDPPKFARDRAALQDALRGYRRLYNLGLQLLNPNGILSLCCCSGLITAEMLEEVITQVAIKAGRDVQILERRGASADHPTSVTCRETAYLKCIITHVA